HPRIERGVTANEKRPHGSGRHRTTVTANEKRPHGSGRHRTTPLEYGQSPGTVPNAWWGKRRGLYTLNHKPTMLCPPTPNDSGEAGAPEITCPFCRRSWPVVLDGNKYPTAHCFSPATDSPYSPLP